MKDMMLKMKGKEETERKISLYCPYCGNQHIDQGEYATNPHRWHLCFSCKKKFWIPKPTIGIN